MNLNHAIILGRVTADPQLKTTQGGSSVASFGVATNRTWNDKDGQKREEVEFHTVVTFGRQAEVACQFLKKGSLVLIEGRIATRTWTGKDNVERRTTEIICENMQLGPRPQAQAVTAKVEATPVRELAEEEKADALFAEPADAPAQTEELPF